MKILEYVDFTPPRNKSQYARVREAIERDDFRAADVKKLSNLTQGKFYRAKLDYADRLLFSIVRFNGEAYALMLEVIEQHAYDKSRFLRGASIDDARIPEADPAEAIQDAEPVGYLNPNRPQVHWLDKVISFDDAQQEIYLQPTPLIIVGSAGSGKTALTLEKMKQAQGDILYVTLSAYLAQSARDLYYAHGFDREGQETSFLSFREFLESIRVPHGREATWRDFSAWFSRMRQQFKGVDAHQAFEEIRGVITADAAGVLTREQYAALGARQSIFPPVERAALYELFEKYRTWLQEAGLFDLNLVAHGWQRQVQPRYDFVVIDEVQDLTPVQLALVLRMLRKPGQFLLCGDSNQIVHPNFFSWSKVKTLFWHDPELAERQLLHILQANFRNGKEVTRIANTLLKVKHRRFGSIDRESNFLVNAVNQDAGAVSLLADSEAVRRELNAQTRRSTRFAVLVLRDDDKAEARKHFDTPLIFSVHEAKGLEYDSIVLYRFVSGNRAQFAAIADGVDASDLAGDALQYARARDKNDKSLEIYKFYVNALYVALTRAIRSVYLVESDSGHPLLRLLDIAQLGAAANVTAQASSLEDWQKEARKLALQGKQEQADAIERMILKTTPVPWPVVDEPRLRETLAKVFREQAPGSKAKNQLYDYATCFNEPILAYFLAMDAGFDQARGFPAHEVVFGRRHYLSYFARNFKDILKLCDKHGVEHRTPMNQTPLMAAAAAGNLPLVEALLERGADTSAVDHLGRNALHWALATALRDDVYAKGPFGAVYQLVAPACIDLMAGERLVRIDARQSEYLMLQTMWVLFKSCFGSANSSDRGGFDAATLLGAYARIPASVMAPERAKRAFISGVLARNEVDRDYAYNRCLFQRVKTGLYQLNPALSLRRRGPGGDDEWVPVYSVLNLALVKELADPYHDQHIDGLLALAGLPPTGEPSIRRSGRR
ncbi:UvrD-helicase domain-containing protein [Massilia yuzhufengensis]|uniref:UvrD/REP helicase N-terminal domain-containing protein n=1 Tax=Massilia yuzhufengensis TaxID=1164594 RepID=A0A1I1UCE9_9BURK|nr:UvrD-helicase domain-containing protein [Massilia yuzhufengensis]SFD68541.1 UvrD/REP helicase N-terminal domain-containing protein [Massilia yuzhufengensis]